MNDTSLNYVLFIQLGVPLGLLPRSRRALGLVIVAFALPWAIEATQLLVPVLGRGCQSADVVDNSLGLLLGLGVTMVAVRLWSP